MQSINFLRAESGDRYVSPVHDIPLYADSTGSVLNMVVEIPRWTNAKMEVRLRLLILVIMIMCCHLWLASAFQLT